MKLARIIDVIVARWTRIYFYFGTFVGAYLINYGMKFFGYQPKIDPLWITALTTIFTVTIIFVFFPKSHYYTPRWKVSIPLTETNIDETKLFYEEQGWILKREYCNGVSATEDSIIFISSPHFTYYFLHEADLIKFRLAF